MRRRPFLQLSCITFGVVLTQSSRLSSRKTSTSQTFDPYIICDNPGPKHVEGLPLQYSEDVYSESIALCSSAHGARENVGCFCATPSGRVHCSEHVADRDLWEARYIPIEDESHFDGEEVSFPELCQEACQCVSEDDAQQWFHETENEYFWQASGFRQPREPPRRGAHDGTTFATGSLIGNSQEISQPSWQNQCGNNCTSAKDCSAPAGGNSTCMCQAHSSQHQPASGTVAFMAACLVTLASGGKREEGLPCPCNSTYVSHHCCDVPDGWVWEPPDSNLGVLLPSP